MESQELLSHKNKTSNFDHALSQTVDRIKKAGDKPHVTVEQQLSLLSELSRFALGQFLIENKGLNGYWTHYLLSYPKFKSEKSFSDVETFMLRDAPTTKATQQRSQIFLAENQEKVAERATLCSVPCGMMGELLFLDFSDIEKINLVGIDQDAACFAGATTLLELQRLPFSPSFQCKDAYALQSEDKFDLISSNGLNIYQSNQSKNQLLYNSFYNALKKNGKLVVSYLTPPPSEEKPDDCEWNWDEINREHLLKQRIIFKDIIDANWTNYTSTKDMLAMIKKAGFKNIRVEPDAGNLFPTLVAYK